MKRIKKALPDLLYVLALTLLFLSPYLMKDLLPIEHDTFFHVSRIEQLSVSIREGTFLPAIYPYENNGFGYASPLFYSDVLLIPSALLHLAGIPVSVCYKLTIALSSFAGAYTLLHMTARITKNRSAAWIAAAASQFSNYRITDVYVRGALGEIFALIFLPMIIEAMYRILQEKDFDSWFLLAMGLCGLALSHNLTFLMGSVLTAILFFLQIRRMDIPTFLSVLKGVLTAFLLTAFYTIPMIEQLSTQEFVVNYYAQTSSLESYSMDLWQFFANKTVFGLAGNYLPKESTMLENAGLFLTFAPFLFFLLPKDVRKQHSFSFTLLLLGLICLLLPSSLLPWQSMHFLRIMQFPWRFQTLTILLLSVPAGLACSMLLKPRVLKACLVLLLAAEGIWHVLPVCERTFGIRSDQTWGDVLNGALCDPYYSAYYVRVELAGGDYLPLHTCDYRGRSTAIRDLNDSELDIPYEKNGTSLTFTLSDAISEPLVLPLTWYKGYRIYRMENGKKRELSCSPSPYSLVSFTPDGAGEYLCIYRNTAIRTACRMLSLAAWLLLLYDRMQAKRLIRRN